MSLLGFLTAVTLVSTQLFVLTHRTPILLLKELFEVFVLAVFTILMHPLFHHPFRALYLSIKSLFQALLSDVKYKFITLEGPRLAPIPQTYDLGKEEPEAEYKPGGYYPVRINERFHKGRYKVLRKLGWGVSSTVWLALDTYHVSKKPKQREQASHKYIALKILRSSSSSCVQELSILQKIEAVKAQHPEHHGVKHLPTLLDSFKCASSSGEHQILVMKLLGPNIITMKNLLFGHHSSCVSDTLAKVFARDTLRALQFLHELCGVIHADIKFDNILYPFSNTDKVVDLYLAAHPLPCGISKRWFDHVISESLCTAENLPFVQPVHVLNDFSAATWKHKHRTEIIQPIVLRAPEVMFKLPWDEKVDVWNLALILHEFAGFGRMFDGVTTDVLEQPRLSSRRKSQYRQASSSMEETEGNVITYKKPNEILMIDQIIALLGGVPKRYYTKFGHKIGDYFDNSGRIKDKFRLMAPTSWQAMLDSIIVAEEPSAGSTAGGNLRIRKFYGDLLWFLHNAVAYKHNRLTAEQLLNHEWLQDLDAEIAKLPRLQNIGFCIISFHRNAQDIEALYDVQAREMRLEERRKRKNRRRE